MKVYLATDHAGFFLKERVKLELERNKYEVMDMGAFVLEESDDYPDFISKAAIAVSHDGQSKGIIFGGSGQGEAIVANKFSNIRAVVFYGPVKSLIKANGKTENNSKNFSIIELARLHNDANILSLGARFISEVDALYAVSLFLTTLFSEDDRHERRIKKISTIENEIILK